MNLTIEDYQGICNWLIEKGMGFGEAAQVIADLEKGDSFPVALLQVFVKRKKFMEDVRETSKAYCGTAIFGQSREENGQSL